MIKEKVSNLVSFLSKKFSIAVFFLVSFFLPVIFIYADGFTCDDSTGKICNPISATSLQGLIKTILEGVIKIGIPIIALAIIYSGFLFVQARGKPGEIEKAKNSLIYTLIGAAILLGAWAIAQLISETVLVL
jgi:hypothetical protein